MASRQYTAGRFAVELAGSPVGFVASAGGGEAVGVVVQEKVGTDHVVHKHIGNIKYEDLVVTCGTGLSDDFYDWIAAVFDHTLQGRDGAISFLDVHGNETSRLSWLHGSISEVGFPALDAASKDGAFLTLRIAPQSVTQQAGTGSSPKVGGKPGAKKWVANTFRLAINGIDCTHVSRIDAITVKQSVVEDAIGDLRDHAVEPAGLDIPNIVVTVPQSHAKDFVDWHQDFVIKGNNGQGSEREGKIEFLSSDGSEALFTLTLKGLGIVRASATRSVSGSAGIAEIEAEMYCEEMSLDYMKGPAPATGSTATTSSQPTGSMMLLDPNAALLTALRGLLIGGGSPVPLLTAARSPESVAARLLTGAGNGSQVETEAAGSGDRGRRLGAEWARERAGLEELEQIAAMRGGDWTHLELGEDHSLLAFLADGGIIIHASSGGPTDLERDPFVEGLVEGAADVYDEVRPHLGDRTRLTDIR